MGRMGKDGLVPKTPQPTGNGLSKVMETHLCLNVCKVRSSNDSYLYSSDTP